MGCVPSKAPVVDEAAKARNDWIDKQIQAERNLDKNEIRMLLLGAGESGKSTILKQMRIIHDGGYATADRVAYKEIIMSNTIQSMKTVLTAMDDLVIDLLPQNEKYREVIRRVPANFYADHLPSQLYAAIAHLRQDPGVEEAISRNNEYQLNDSTTYFFDSIERMNQKGYVPNDQDILRSRVKTTGITEVTFPVKDRIYKVYDVGGQRSERRKWIHCFENLNAVIFMVALSEYDQVLREDENVNRMHESLVLFQSICNSPWFTKTSMILFLNKMDLLREKLPRSPLSIYLRDYDGADDFNSAVAYFRKLFVRCNRQKDRQMYTHVTCATDTQQITFVLHAMHDILVKTNLKTIGLL